MIELIDTSFVPLTRLTRFLIEPIFSFLCYLIVEPRYNENENYISLLKHCEKKKKIIIIIIWQ